MGLEAATFIGELVESNPTGLDAKKEGDNHIRMIKAALKNSFPNVLRAFNLAEWSEKSAKLVEKAVDYGMDTSDNGKLVVFDCSAASRTYNLAALAAAGEGFVVFVARDSSAKNTLTLDANGAELINGQTTLVIRAGILYCGGAGKEWKFFACSDEPAGFRIEKFTTTGANTWNKKPGLKGVFVRVQAGGGSGGGIQATGAAQSNAGSGGGGGGYTEKWIDAKDLGDSETVTVGAGVAGTTGVGATGGTSSFGAHCSALGGQGGDRTGPSGARAGIAGGPGGTASGGDLNISGSLGGTGTADFYNTGGGSSNPGLGGGSHMGQAPAGILTMTVTAANGHAGQQYGCGGGGARSGASQSAASGGTSAQGIVTVEERY